MICICFSTSISRSAAWTTSSNARTARGVLRAALHVEEERVVERLHDERHARSAARPRRRPAVAPHRQNRKRNRENHALDYTLIRSPQTSSGGSAAFRHGGRGTTSPLAWGLTRTRSRASGAGALPASLQSHVDEDCDDDDDADDDLLEERRHVQQVETVPQHAHDQRADERARQRPFAAEQARCRRSRSRQSRPARTSVPAVGCAELSRAVRTTAAAALVRPATP